MKPKLFITYRITCDLCGYTVNGTTAHFKKQMRLNGWVSIGTLKTHNTYCPKCAERQPNKQ